MRGWSVEAKLDDIAKLVIEDAHSNDPAIVCQALKQLADSMKGPNMTSATKSRQEAYETGGLTTTVAIMKKWLHEEAVQLQGCRLIANMMSATKEELMTYIGIFSKIGGAEVILSAFRTYPESLELQRAGMAAFFNVLSHPEKDDAKKVARRFVNDLGGIQLVLRTMRSYPTDPKVQKTACLLLSNLCSASAEFQSGLRQSGAISAVGNAIDYHREDEEIQKWGFAFLKKVIPK